MGTAGKGVVPRPGGPLAKGGPGCQCTAAADDGRPEGSPEAAPGGSAGNQTAATGTAPKGQGPGGDSSIVDHLKKDPGLLGRGRGGLTSPEDRQKALEILEDGLCSDNRAQTLAALLGVGLSTLQRWRRQVAGDGDGIDRRKGSHRVISHRLKEEERHRILLTCNQPEFAALPPGQIVPILADQSLYNSSGEDFVYGSERSFYRVLHAHGQAHRRGRARPPQEPREVPQLEAKGPNQVWSWGITYLPTSVRGVSLYLYLVIDV